MAESSPPCFVHRFTRITADPGNALSDFATSRRFFQVRPRPFYKKKRKAGYGTAGAATVNSDTRNQMIILLIGVLIGAAGYLANSLYLWHASIDKERSDIAEGLYLDVASLEDPLVVADQESQTPGDTCDDFVFVQSNLSIRTTACTTHTRRTSPRSTAGSPTTRLHSIITSSRRNGTGS